jgi:hypothetical protein
MHPNQLRLFPLTRPDEDHKSGRPMWKDFPNEARPIDERLTSHREKGGNLAVSTDGLIVLDIDTRRAGEEGLQLLEMAQQDLPRTYTVRTPGGGKHIYFKASKELANSHDKLAPGIDVKAYRGFVVAAGARRPDGDYTVETDAPIADAPEWLEALCEAPRDTEAGKEVLGAELDTKQNVERAKAYLETAEPAIQGAGGDNHTFKTIAAVLDFGISVPQATELMHGWNERCQPPWQPEELERKIDNAAKYRSKPQGADDPTAEFDVFTPPPTGIEPRGTRDVKAKALAKRKWLLGKMAIRGKLTLLIAPPGAGKSTLTIGAALSVASGRDLIGMEPHEQTGAWLYNNEDDLEELHRRLAAQAQAFDVDLEALGDRLYLNSGEQRPIMVARKRGHGADRKLFKTQDIAEIERHVTEKGIGLLIVDPFSETHEGDENDNVEMRAVAALFRGIAQRANVAVILVHHTRKLPTGNSDGHAGNMDSARGASSVSGVARVVQTLYGMSQKDAKRCGVPEAQRSLYVRLDDAKTTLSAPSGGHPRWYRRESVDLETTDGGTESVGVLVPVTLTEISEEDDMDVLDKAVLEICDGRPRLMADVVRGLQEHPEFAGRSRTGLYTMLGRVNSEAWQYERKEGREGPGPARIVPLSDFVTDFDIEDMAQ